MRVLRGKYAAELIACPCPAPVLRNGRIVKHPYAVLTGRL